MVFMCFCLGAERPQARRVSASVAKQLFRRRTARPSVSRRPKIVSAAATESCWLTTIDISASKPSSRRLAMGHLPARFTTACEPRIRREQADYGLDPVALGVAMRCGFGMDRKCVARAHDCHAFRAKSNGLAASGPCLCRDLTAADAGDALPAAHRGHRHARVREEFEAAIFEDLAWLGLRLGEAGAAAIRRGSTPIAQRSRGWRRKGCSIPVSARARRSPTKSRAPAKRRMGRRPALSRHVPPSFSR